MTGKDYGGWLAPGLDQAVDQLVGERIQLIQVGLYLSPSGGACHRCKFRGVPVKTVVQLMDVIEFAVPVEICGVRGEKMAEFAAMRISDLFGVKRVSIYALEEILETRHPVKMGEYGFVD